MRPSYKDDILVQVERTERFKSYGRCLGMKSIRGFFYQAIHFYTEIMKTHVAENVTEPKVEAKTN